MSSLPGRIVPSYVGSPLTSLLSLHWPEPPRNVLMMPKLYAPHVTLSSLEFAKHIHANYPGLNLIFERHIAETVHNKLPFPIYTADTGEVGDLFPEKVDLVSTLGGDGTILRAASLFSHQESVPPILSFSMGSLGFLGEWKFEEYKRAWREVYMSGSDVQVEDLVEPHTQTAVLHGRAGGVTEVKGGLRPGWEKVRGKSMGIFRTSKVLLRHRLRVGIYDSHGNKINGKVMPTSADEPDLEPPTSPSRGSQQCLHAINEVSIDRGVHPHLAMIDIYVNNHFLTEAVADGLIISTPTGSTAYSLSAGGPIVHPLVKSMIITPISARSLSFRPLVLPLNTKVVLKLSKRNRGRELPVSIDGKRRAGVGVGMEIRIEGESLVQRADGVWAGGVPCIIRASGKGEPEGIAEDDDSWVGGLNGLLKFNYPFGEVH